MKKNMNNRSNAGFSLVELIIVIAIMAILIGVLAPQFIKYVESSKKSTDIQNVDEIITAINVYCADPDNDPTTLDKQKIVLSVKTPVVLEDEPTLDAVQTVLIEAGIKSYSLKSAEWATDKDTITLEIEVKNGVPKYSITGANEDYDILAGKKKKTEAATPTPTP